MRFEEIISDTSHFKIFLRSDNYFIYNTDINLIKHIIFIKDIIKKKDIEELKISKSIIDNIIKVVLTEIKKPIIEYTENNNSYIITRRGYPSNWLDFNDIITDELSPAIASLLIYKNILYFSFCRDKTVMKISFEDDDIFTNLFYILNENNITEIIINDKNYERILINMGIIVHLYDKRINNKHCDGAIEILVDFLKLKDYSVKEYILKEIMKLDESTLNTLDIFNNEKSICSLYRCRSNQGKRLLKQYFKQPLKNIEEIKLRQLFSELFVNINIDDVFSKMVDIVKISKKIETNRISIEEIVRLYYSIKNIPMIIDRIVMGIELYNNNKNANNDKYNNNCNNNSNTNNTSNNSINSNITDNIDNGMFTPKTLDSDIPSKDMIVNSKNTSIHDDIEDKIFSELIQPLKSLEDNFHPLLIEIEKYIDLEKTEYNEYILKKDINEEICILIKSMEEIHNAIDILYKSICKINKKVKLEKVGDIYNFKISRIEYGPMEKILKKNGYVPKSVLRGGVVFTSFELEEWNRKLEECLEEYKKLERRIKNELVLFLKGYLAPMDAYNYLIAVMDVYNAFSEKVKDPEYSKPIFNGNYILKNSFHPLLVGRDCIKNDISLVDNKFVVITGPNMGGKSTFLKQCAIISILAQIGSYVPAEYSELTILDGIFIRIGASDCASKNISTFMNEMIDIAHICRMATNQSMVIIDELGRGTSAKDGLALALSVSEFLIKNKTLTFFATHFPEVCKLNTINKRVKTIINQNDVIMLYKLEDGICNTSFGLHVAKIVGFPEEIINEAKNYI
ncbi:DNA mismatch repair protein msh-2 [Spraguea lophii 42_110]|uniref:DNA mismatch repair protein msh-2 n=1 Tax=Spraguea lophii (strain 42_110) TaxID=1358809 RepID=S7W6X5_SPRLO|nr:DNA mismatch repair protein msh-2 [Spraguea lophii 42_110]